MSNPGRRSFRFPTTPCASIPRPDRRWAAALLQWRENGATVNNELETADHSYRDQLLDICLTTPMSESV